MQEMHGVAASWEIWPREASAPQTFPKFDSFSKFLTVLVFKKTCKWFDYLPTEKISLQNLKPIKLKAQSP